MSQRHEISENQIEKRKNLTKRDNDSDRNQNSKTILRRRVEIDHLLFRRDNIYCKYVNGIKKNTS